MKHIVKPLVVAVVAGSLLSGCMGKFALTGKIYSWNKTAASDRWINEGIFVAFLIVPVYSLSLLADGVIFNSVQWWTGRNPVAQAGDQKRVEGEDGSVALLTLRADGGVDVAMTAATGENSQFRLYRDGQRVNATDVDGRPLDVVVF